MSIKNCALMIMFWIIANFCYAQNAKVDSSYANWYYQQRIAYFAKTPIPKNAIVLLGSSTIEKAEWQELLADSKFPIVNRGIGGDNSFGVLARLEEILNAKPKAVFYMIGANDQFRKLPHEVSVSNYRQIIKKIKQRSANTKIYIGNSLPINEQITKQEYTKGRTKLVREINEKVKLLAAEEKVVYIDLYSLFVDEKGALKSDVTMDGVHLKPLYYIDLVKFLKEKQYL